MNFNPRLQKQSLIKLLLLALVSEGCVTIEERTFCSTEGDLSVGMICTHLIGTGYNLMDFNHSIDFLQAEPSRPDPDHPGQTLPAHGAAISMSAEDFNGFKTEHEEMCRELGKKCIYSTVGIINATPTPSVETTERLEVLEEESHAFDWTLSKDNK